MDELEHKSRELFLEASELPAAERPAFLERRCPGSAELRARVEALLAHHAESEGLFTRPGAAAPTGAGAERGAAPGRVGEFELGEELGRGGMGVVYRSMDTALNRPVAVKVISDAPSASGDAVERLQREARAAARLSHPGIVSIYRFGEDRGAAYIAMELVEGTTLRARLESWGAGSPDVAAARARLGAGHARECARLLHDVADALDHAHRRGVIHRDIKPSNILITPDGRARLTDFGVARIQTERTLNSPGTIAGSIPYMSPEQARARAGEVDHRSDIFSLGVVLYEALTLRRPFVGATAADVVAALSSCDPPRLERVGGVPRDLAVVCHKAIEKRPEDRYQTAAHLAADLRCVLEGVPILAAPPSLARRARVWLRRRRRGVAAVLLTGVLGAAGALGYAFGGGPREAPVELSVISRVGACRLSVRRVDLATHEAAPDARPLGDTPCRGAELAPGAYRITAAESGGPGLVEFDVHVPAAGGAPLRLEVVAADWKPADHDAGVLRGVLRNPAVSSPMLRIPAGEYRYGARGATNHAVDAERTVKLDAFDIDAREVTNGEYAAFMAATGGPAPVGWSELGSDPALRDRPVIGVTLGDAAAYARWAGKRLPSVLEWEAAARGPRGDLYPGGDRPPADPMHRAYVAGGVLVPAGDSNDFRSYRSFTVDAGVVADGAAPASGGLLHTWDNVREYTSSLSADGGSVQLRGRCWTDAPDDKPLTTAFDYPTGTSSVTIGFRCARSIPPSAASAPSGDRP